MNLSVLWKVPVCGGNKEPALCPCAILRSWQHPDLSKGSKVQDIELKSSDFTPELGSDAGLGSYQWECTS